MKTKIISHRGYCRKYPENTMRAFQEAVEIGCDGIEIDVQLSRDGVPVIIHDENLRRVTGRSGFVKDFNYDELKLFDASYGFDAKLGINRIPTLEKYLAYVSGLDIISDIELKNSIFRYEGMEQKIAAMVKKYKLEDRVMFSSFNHHSLHMCKELLPDIPCGLLIDCWLKDAGAYTRRCGAEYINPHYTFLTPENYRELEENEIGAMAWTVDDQEEMDYLVGLGIFAVISDRPDLFIAKRNENKAAADGRRC